MNKAEMFALAKSYWWIIVVVIAIPILFLWGEYLYDWVGEYVYDSKTKIRLQLDKELEEAKAPLIVENQILKAKNEAQAKLLDEWDKHRNEEDSKELKEANDKLEAEFEAIDAVPPDKRKEEFCKTHQSWDMCKRE